MSIKVTGRPGHRACNLEKLFAIRLMTPQVTAGSLLNYDYDSELNFAFSAAAEARLIANTFGLGFT
jgi:hypothetical protein